MGDGDQCKGIGVLAFPIGGAKVLALRKGTLHWFTPFPRLTPPILFFGFKAKPQSFLRGRDRVTPIQTCLTSRSLQRGKLLRIRNCLCNFRNLVHPFHEPCG